MSRTAICGAVAMALAAPAHGQLVNPRVTHGSAKIQTNGKATRITTGSKTTIINYDQVNILADQSVRIDQPGKSALTVNRVTRRNAPTTIAGKLSSNGNVWVLNPGGIAINRGAQVKVNGFLATTANIPDEDILSGRYEFSGAPDGSAVINDGRIIAEQGGVVLVAPVVRNTGAISVDRGDVALAAASDFAVDFDSDGLTRFEVSGNSGVEIENAGAVTAEGGSVYISAAAADDVQDQIVSIGGAVEATRIEDRGGVIVISGGASGGVEISGRVDVSQSSGTGGTAIVTGGAVSLTGTAALDASGPAGGGRILVGGARHGADLPAPAALAVSGAPESAPLPRARSVSVEAGATVTADATQAGQGGEIVLWADDTMRYAGAISATGAGAGGDGGFAEVSGRQDLLFAGTADLSALDGAFGTLLLDPTDITISNDATAFNIINAGDLVAALDSANVTISTANGAANLGNAPNDPGRTDAGNITVAEGLEAIALSGGNATTLTLDADNDIIVNGAIAEAAGSDPLALVLQADNAVEINADIALSGSISIAADVVGDDGSNIALLEGVTVASGDQLTLALGGSGAVVDTDDAAQTFGTVTLISGAGFDLPLAVFDVASLEIQAGGAVSFGALTAAGDLTVAAAGAITDTDGLAISVDGTTSLLAAAVDPVDGITDSFDITLDSTDGAGVVQHDFADRDSGGQVNATGAAITIVDVDSIRLGTVGAETVAAGVASEGALTVRATDFQLVNADRGAAEITTAGGRAAFERAGGGTLLLGDLSQNGASPGDGAVIFSNIDLADIEAGTLAFDTGGGQALLSGLASPADVLEITAGAGTVAFVDTDSSFTGLTISGAEIVQGAEVDNEGSPVPLAAASVAVSGTASLSATGDVLLDTIINDFGAEVLDGNGVPDPDASGSLSVSAVNARIAEVDAIALGAVTADTLEIRARGAITDTDGQAIAVSGTTTLFAAETDEGGGIVQAFDIALDSTDADGNGLHDFADEGSTGRVDLTGAAVTIGDADSLVLGDIAADSLSVGAGGTITDADGTAITVPGATTLVAERTDDTGAVSRFDIVLDNVETADAPAHDFADAGSTGRLDVRAANLTIGDTDSLRIGTVSAIDAAGPSVSVTASDVELVDVTAGAADVVLEDDTGDRAGTVAFTATGTEPVLIGDLTDTEAEALFGFRLSDAEIDGISADLVSIDTRDTTTVLSGVTTDGPGGLAVDAGTGAVAFADRGSSFAALSVSGDTVSQGIALDDGESTVTLGAAGVTVTGIAGISATGDIALDTVANDFGTEVRDIDGVIVDADTGQLDLTGAQVSVREENGLALGAITADSLTVVSEGGAIIDRGGEAISVSGNTSLTAQARDESGVLTNTFNILLNNTAGGVPVHDFADIGSQATFSAAGRSVTVGDLDSIALGSIDSRTLAGDADGLQVMVSSADVEIPVSGETGPTVNLTDANGVTAGTAKFVSHTGGAVLVGDLADEDGLAGFAYVLSNDSLSEVNARTIAADSSGGDVSVSALDAPAETVEIAAGTGTVTFGDQSSTFDNLTVSSAGEIGQDSGTIVTVAGVGALTADGDIVLDNPDNDFSAIARLDLEAGGRAAIADQSAITLGTVSVGTLAVDAGGTIHDSVGLGITVTGTTSLSAVDADGVDFFDVLLDNADLHDFGGAVSVSAEDAVLDDANALALGAITTRVDGDADIASDALGLENLNGNDGDLMVNAGGAITDTEGQAITVNGATSLVAEDAAGTTVFDIVLDNADTHDFADDTVVARTHARGAAITLDDRDGIRLGRIDGQALRVRARGNIADTDDLAISVSGITSLAAFSEESGVDTRHDIVLDSIGPDDAPVHDFGDEASGGRIDAFGGDITVADGDGITLGEVDADNLTVTALGNIEDTGPSDTDPALGVTVTGITSLTGRQIFLDNGVAKTVTTDPVTGDVTVKVTGLEGDAVHDFADVLIGSSGTSLTGLTFDGDEVVIVDRDGLALGGASTARGDAAVVSSDLDLFSADGTLSGTIVVQNGADSDLETLTFATLGGTLGLGDVAETYQFNALQLNQIVTDRLRFQAFGGMVKSNNFNSGTGVKAVIIEAETVHFTANDGVDQIGDDTTAVDLIVNEDGGSDTSVITQGSNPDNQDGSLFVSGNAELNAGRQVRLRSRRNKFRNRVRARSRGNRRDDLQAFDPDQAQIAIANEGTITLSGIDTTTDLLIDAGAIIDTPGEAIRVDGITSLSATGDIVLDNGVFDPDGPTPDQPTGAALHDFSDGTGASEVNISAASATLVDQDEIVLGAVSLTGNLTIAAGGTIDDTDGSAIEVAGTTSLLAAALDESGASTGSFDVLIDTADTHDFTGAVSAAGNDVVIDDVNQLLVGRITTSADSTGNLTLRAGAGGITDGTDGVISVAGATSLEAVDPQTDVLHDIVLDNGLDDDSVTRHTFGSNGAGDVGVDALGAGITLSAQGDIVLDDISAGVLEQPAQGVDFFTAGLDGNGDAQTGSLTVSTLNGTISDVAGAGLSVAGETTLTAEGLSNAGVRTFRDVDLGNGGTHRFAGPVNIGADDLTLTAAGLVETPDAAGGFPSLAGADPEVHGLILGSVTVTGNADIEASGTILDTEDRAISVDGSTSILASDGAGDFFDIALDATPSGTPVHSFDGALSVEGEDVRIVASGPVVLGDVTTHEAIAGEAAGATADGAIGAGGFDNTPFNPVDPALVATLDAAGDFSLTATGAVSQQAGDAVTVDGRTRIVAASDPADPLGSTLFDVALGNADNDFDANAAAGGDAVHEVDIIGANVTVTDKTALALGSVVAGGNLIVGTGGSLTDTDANGVEALDVGGAAFFIAGETADQFDIALDNLLTEQGASGKVVTPVHRFGDQVSAIGEDIEIAADGPIQLATIRTQDGTLTGTQDGTISVFRDNFGEGDALLARGDLVITASGAITDTVLEFPEFGLVTRFPIVVEGRTSLDASVVDPASSTGDRQTFDIVLDGSVDSGDLGGNNNNDDVDEALAGLIDEVLNGLDDIGRTVSDHQFGIGGDNFEIDARGADITLVTGGTGLDENGNVVDVNAGNPVAIVNDDVVLGAITATGDLRVDALGTVSDSNVDLDQLPVSPDDVVTPDFEAIEVAGSTTILAGNEADNAEDIILDNPSTHDFGGSFNALGASVVVVDRNDIELGAVLAVSDAAFEGADPGDPGGGALAPQQPENLKTISPADGSVIAVANGSITDAGTVSEDPDVDAIFRVFTTAESASIFVADADKDGVGDVVLDRGRAQFNATGLNDTVPDRHHQLGLATFSGQNVTFVGDLDTASVLVEPFGDFGTQGDTFARQTINGTLDLVLRPRTGDTVTIAGAPIGTDNGTSFATSANGGISVRVRQGANAATGSLETESSLVSSAGAITLGTDKGDVTIGVDALASGNVTVTSTGDVTAGRDIGSVNGNVRITATNDVTAGRNIFAGGGTKVAALALNLDTVANAVLGSSLVVFDNAPIAGNSVGVEAGGGSGSAVVEVVALTGEVKQTVRIVGQAETGNGDVTIVAGGDVTVGGSIDAAGNADVDAASLSAGNVLADDSVTVEAGAITVTQNVTAGQDVVLLSDEVDVGNEVTAGADVVVISDDTIDVLDAISAGGGVLLDAAGAINVVEEVSGANEVVIDAGDGLTVGQSVRSTNSTVDVTVAGGPAEIGGTVAGATGVTVTAAQGLAVGGAVNSARGGVDLAISGGAATVGGAVNGSTGVDITATRGLAVGGSVASTAGTVDLAVTGGAATVGGSVNGSRGVVATATQGLRVGGAVNSGSGAIDLGVSGGETRVGGAINAQQDVTVLATRGLAVGGAVNSVAGAVDLTVRGARGTTGGSVTAADGIDIDATQGFSIGGGVQTDEGNIEIGVTNGDLAIARTVTASSGNIEIEVGNGNFVLPAAGPSVLFDAAGTLEVLLNNGTFSTGGVVGVLRPGSEIRARGNGLPSAAGAGRTAAAIVAVDQAFIIPFDPDVQGLNGNGGLRFVTSEDAFAELVVNEGFVAIGTVPFDDLVTEQGPEFEPLSSPTLAGVPDLVAPNLILFEATGGFRFLAGEGGVVGFHVQDTNGAPSQEGTGSQIGGGGLEVGNVTGGDLTGFSIFDGGGANQAIAVLTDGRASLLGGFNPDETDLINGCIVATLSSCTVVSAVTFPVVLVDGQLLDITFLDPEEEEDDPFTNRGDEENWE